MIDLSNETIVLIYAPLLIIAIGILSYYFFQRLIKRLLSLKVGEIDVSYRRQKTLSNLFDNIIKYIIIIIVLLLILSVYGFETNALLTSLGVISVILGLAFQDIIKDFLSGIFILLEGNYTEGDTVEIGGFKGDIIDIGFRTTKLKAYTGETKIISNRTVNDVINYSLNDAIAIVDIKFGISEPTNKIEKILDEVVNIIDNKFVKTTGKAESLGIQAMDDLNATYRITVPTKANENIDVQHDILKEVKLILEKTKRGQQ